MTNKKLNARMRQQAVNNKEDYFFKRSGRCNPAKCSSACCRFIVSNMYEDDYHKQVNGWVNNPIDTFVDSNNRTYIVSAFHCPQMSINGNCKLHDAPQQSAICDMFPTVPNDAVYEYIKEYCGYKFERVELSTGTPDEE